jgi:hypothetical protein
VFNSKRGVSSRLRLEGKDMIAKLNDASEVMVGV